MNRIAIFAAGLAGLFLSVPAGAVTKTADGVIIFTQADVNAGNITPGDTPGFPASLLVSGSYRLGSALTLTSLKNGIVISAPAVTLDLGGFKVSGGAAGRTGILSNQVDTKVMNGTVRGFTEHGISGTGDFLVVDNVSVTNNVGNGIHFGKNNGSARIARNLVSGNQNYGIACFYSACLIEANIVTKNGTGIIAEKGSVVLGNVIRQNMNIGLLAYTVGYANNFITDNGTNISNDAIPLDPNACYPACP